MQHAVNKILIIGPSWVGDMVMAQSLFIALKEQNPSVIIDVLALAWTKPLLDRMPEVNQSITMPISHGHFAWSMRKELGIQLREEQYDQSIVLANSWKSALIPWFAKIPIRTGWLGEMRYGLLNDFRRLDKQALPLMVQRFVSLAYPAQDANKIPKYTAPFMVAKPTAFSQLPTLNEGQKRLILCPGAEFGAAKQWPSSHYAELAQSFLEKNWQVLILGSPADEETGEEIVNHITAEQKLGISNLCGKTLLQDAIDILATADYVVSNDSGLMHIAAALQKPLIAIYGPTSPKFTPPLSANAQIIQKEVDCGPCFQRECPEKHHKCMKTIESEQIMQLIKDKD